ncbi:MAG: hypothetical protein OXN17_07430 [Candidatus Poribacteria bacterium]|nr:hypothetical protein [Candidatus Poribacteria bacterium]MDE0503436.1 hypothetical protein [Candidatus Poribacteria bacterium]
MNDNIGEALRRGTSYLMAQSHDAGFFEGELSSSTFPTCAYAWVQFALGKTPDAALIEWLLRNQNQDGTWSLDVSDQPNQHATLFAELLLQQFIEQQPTPEVETALARIPDFPLDLALVKLAYAAFGQAKWTELTISKNMLPVLALVQKISALFPRLRAVFKPPTKILPPVDFINTPMFTKLFIAEQHTLAAVFLMIELNTTKRIGIIDCLFDWLKSHVVADGSWFRVNYITALSLLALIELRKRGFRNGVELDRMIDEGLSWLGRTRNSDGGCREALNLNVWDTALSVISVTDIDASESANELQSAGVWLVQNQNADGGWAFSGLPGSNLPSDADDTALALCALLKLKLAGSDSAMRRGFQWLLAHQGRDGSWSTYLPGQGDVGCVSITAHAIEALLESGGWDTNIDRACRWLKRQMSTDGHWSDLWLAKNTYGTANAITALILTGEGDCNEVRQGVEWLEDAQNPDGGWGEDMLGNPAESTVEQTAWSAGALLLADPQNKAGWKGIKFLLDHQRADGSWNASCVGIYWEIIGGYADPINASVFPLRALHQAKCAM